MWHNREEVGVFMKDIIVAVEKHSQLILDAEAYIWEHAETGYKEFETSKYLAENFEKLVNELLESKSPKKSLFINMLSYRRF